ncbi:MAG: PrsW family glutamic-type intramembrane protease [Haloferacaceae archaeon]
MTKRRDPVSRATDDRTDLYDVATWEPRSLLDRVAVLVYRVAVGSARAAVILVGLLLLVAIGGLSAVTDPQVGVLTALSAVPAFGLAAYVWYSDVTTTEPPSLLVATFLLAVLTATFAALLNTYLQQPFAAIGLAGTAAFFFLVVGPVEETVKLLAVRLYAYADDRFDAVVDGTVYGAAAGLGFAFIENALYITRQVDVSQLEFGLGLIGAGGGITAVRALAGPGHVIYSAFAGYYLGLAKFNPEHRGPIVVKGLLIAAFIHGLYNSTVGIGSGAVAALTGLPGMLAFFAYILVYDGVFGLLLVRKINRYNAAFHDAPDEELPDEHLDGGDDGTETGRADAADEGPGGTDAGAAGVDTPTADDGDRPAVEERDG